jgi:translation initiation factor SUI1
MVISSHSRLEKKFITIIEGLDEELDHSSILKAMKKSFRCNGSTTVDPKFGEIIQLSGDKRVDVYELIIEQGLCELIEMKKLNQ